jgi:D-alanyl-D-alanine carboxypeptidase
VPSFTALIPQLRPFASELVRAAGAAGLQPRVTSTRRSFSQQKRLYDRYLAGLSPYPAAPPGHSAHEYGFAFDMISLDNAACGDYWESLGGIWGGRGGDDVHFEFPGFKATYGAQIATAAALDAQNVPLPWGVDVLDFASSFIPYVGGMQLAALLLAQIFPELKKKDLYQMLETPASYIDRWAIVQGILPVPK